MNSTRVLANIVCSFLIIKTVEGLLTLPPLIAVGPQPELYFHVSNNLSEQEPFMLNCGLGVGLRGRGFRMTPHKSVFYWEKDDEPFDWENNGNISKSEEGDLTFNFPRDSDAGIYRCHGMNEMGISTSEKSNVRKWELNKFVDQTDKEITIHRGGYVELICNEPKSSPKAKILWHHFDEESGTIKRIDNSNRHSIDENNNLWILNVDHDDHMKAHVCIASSEVYLSRKGKSMKVHEIGPRIVLNVIEPETELVSEEAPTKLHTLDTIEALESENYVTIPCIFYGRPVVTVNWLKDGEQFEENKMVLILRYVGSDSSGIYTCEVSNGIGETMQHNTTLKIGIPPRLLYDYEFLWPQMKMITTTGETGAIICNVTGNPQPSIEWFYNARPIAEAPLNSRRIIYESNITITDMQISDNFGVYGCKASNKYGTLYKEHSFFVSDIPVIVGANDNIIAVRGQNQTLYCYVAETAINITSKWFHNKTRIEDCPNSEYSILEDGHLFISNVSQSTAGDYKCEASNQFGSDSIEYHVRTIRPTKVITQPLTVLTKKRSTVGFKCEIDYDPYYTEEKQIPSVSWHKNDKYVSKYYAEDESYHKIKYASVDDTGKYQCHVTSLHESIVSDIAELMLIDENDSEYSLFF